MSHLLAISVGPVQEFITAARRTRDLWFGSHLLSEISGAVADFVAKNGGQLIFPGNLKAGNIANIILAEVPAGDPADLARRAREAARAGWREFADDALKQTNAIVRQDIWQDQVDDVIEFYAAWAPLSGDYRAARHRVMRLLEGRKACRDFLPARGRAGVPKSSLDGRRESVLREPPPGGWPRGICGRMRLKPGEQLDVVGVVKRIGAGSRPYPSVSRVAADPWVRGRAGKLKTAIDACELIRGQEPDAIQKLGGPWAEPYGDFPYEGTALYPSRHHEIIEDAGLDTEQGMALLRPLREALGGLGEPQPYLAVLMADGDRMGEMLSRFESPDEHRRFSAAVAVFADSVAEIVEKHRGVPVYAGGDDVLAFVPVDKCLACARELHDEFSRQLAPYAVGDRPPTLSVGIAIGHFMEDLEDLRNWGDEARKAAKQPKRDGLAVHLHKRSGSPTRVRWQWDARPDVRLMDYAQWIQTQAIPGKLPYDLRKLVDLYQGWPDTATLKDALVADVTRVIRDKQPKGQRHIMKQIEEELENRFSDAASLRSFTEELLIARQIAVAMSQAAGSAGRPDAHSSQAIGATQP